ncbi:MAG: SMC-Scp complex subunit ScpB [bacterium]|nr:SMC-Scp complex subunit ScpB [bacterium]
MERQQVETEFRTEVEHTISTEAKAEKVLDEREQETVVEAVLFAMGQSVETSRLAAALGQDEQTAVAAAKRLAVRYDREQRGMQIVELEDCFQMCTRGKYYENLIRVASVPKKQVLSDVVLETLAIIAYRQPVTKLEIEKIRGVKSDHAVNRLIEYNLVYEAGRMDAPGRPALFATTEEFLRRFGVGSVETLPEIYPEKVMWMREEVEEELKEMEREQENSKEEEEDEDK